MGGVAFIAGRVGEVRQTPPVELPSAVPKGRAMTVLSHRLASPIVISAAPAEEHEPLFETHLSGDVRSISGCGDGRPAGAAVARR